MTAAHFGRRIGTALKEGIERNQSVLQGLWHDPFMAAASRAIADRLPLVDLIVHVTDARIPLSSQCDLLRNYQPSFNHIIALNKADLACPSGLQVWTQYFTEMNCISCKVNAHNKDSIRQFLSLIQRQVGKLKRTDHANYTATVMLTGIPNVGKSALANALHQVGRISAAEKGKLKHATVSPEPGETRDIRSFKACSSGHLTFPDTFWYACVTCSCLVSSKYENCQQQLGLRPSLTRSAQTRCLERNSRRPKSSQNGRTSQYIYAIRIWHQIGSHPNIYVLDTPAVLSREVPDAALLSKLILTGAIGDCVVGRKEIAQYFLSIHNSSEEYKKWAKLCPKDNDILFLNSTTEGLTSSGLHVKQKNQIPTDHTQDHIVQDVRRTLYETVSSFDGNIRCEAEMEALIDRQFSALQEAFHVPAECEDADVKVAGKLLNLFRTGRLGHYVLDNLPKNTR